jgi:hypothetical protein
VQRSAFLENPDVQQFLAWLRGRFDGNIIHCYTDRQTGKDWRCEGLFEASQRSTRVMRSRCSTIVRVQIIHIAPASRRAASCTEAPSGSASQGNR